MKVNIRGGLGTQILSLAGHLARGQVTGIRLNVADVQPSARIDWLTTLFRDAPPVDIVEGRSKLRLTKGLMRKIADLDWPYATCEPPPSEGTVIHMRTGDREPTSQAAYARAMEAYPEAVILRSNGPIWRSGHDWLRVLGANLVVSSLSTFTLSAALVNPRMKLRILPMDGPIAVQPQGVAAFNALIESRPNMAWQ